MKILSGIVNIYPRTVNKLRFEIVAQRKLTEQEMLMVISLFLQRKGKLPKSGSTVRIEWAG